MNHITTVHYKGLDLDVNYDYQPEEKPAYYYSDGSGYPGCAAEFIINAVELNGVDITDLVENQLDAIEEAIYEQSKDNE